MKTPSRRRTFLAVAVAASLMVPVAALAQPVSTWTNPTPADPPSARYGQMGTAYDAVNDRLILFSGEDGGSLPRPTDTWVLSDATGASPAWNALTTAGTPPPGNYAHSVVYAPTSNRIVVYGGCPFNCGTALSGVWTLSDANGLGSTPTWTQLNAVGSDNREGHDAVYDDATNRMIIFGGQNGFNSYGGNPQVRVLTDADGTGVGTPTWTTLTPTGTPPANRESSGIGYDAAHNRLIVFGGATVACCAVVTDVYNDVWVLTNANGLGGTPAWTQLSPSGTGPSARYWTTVEYDAVTNRLILFGGLNGQGGAASDFFNEVWVLTNANGLGGTPEWIQISPSGSTPDGRFAHVTGYSSAGNELVIAMGRNDDTGLLYNDVWVLGNANAAYDFDGFFSPVDNLPTINSLKAGQAVPVRFSLNGDQGLDIFASGYPKSQTVACDAAAEVDGVESTVAAGSSSLSYDVATDVYSYSWKTSKAWAGTCRQLVVKLGDLSVHRATFMLK